MRASLLTLLLCTYAAGCSGAAAETAGLVVRGKVEDSSGATIPGAAVALRQRTGGHVRSCTTDEAGAFSFSDTSPGRYSIRVRAKGFEETEVPVSVFSTPSEVRIRLEVAENAEHVTVSEKIAAVSGQNLDTTEIDQTWFKNFPLKEGDPLALPSLFLDPAAKSAIGGPRIIVDGVEADGLELPVSAIKSARVNSSPYSAEFARPGRGRIEVTTRKGTHRHYRGSLNYIVRNSALDARSAFAPVKAPLGRKIFEGELDGPIGKQFTFFAAGRYQNHEDAAVIAATTPAGFLSENFDTPGHQTRFYGRLDYRINFAQKIIFRYKFKDNTLHNQRVGGFHLPRQATELRDGENEIQAAGHSILSATFSNEARFVWRWRTHESSSRFPDPMVIVQGSFADGGSQELVKHDASTGDIQDVGTYLHSRHTIRLGGGIRPKFYSALDRTNFGGTFTYPTLTSYLANRPQVFSINQGDGLVHFGLPEYSSFVQDQIRVSSNLQLTAGLRQEYQGHVHSSNTFAPRLAVAFAPNGGNTVLRAGAGLFYDRQPEMLSDSALLYGGLHVRQFVVRDPSFGPDSIPIGIGLSGAPSVVRIATNNRPPYIFQWNAAIERRFGSGRNFVSIDFTRLHGLRLYRSRNVNAPLPGSANLPDPAFGSVAQFETSGMLVSNSLTMTFHAQAGRKLDLHTQYTLSRTLDDTFSPFSFPSNGYNLRDEFGRSDLDRRHRLVMAAMSRLPWRMKASAIMTVASGIPFNITTGSDDNHDTIVNDRPPGVGRNTGKGPGEANVDLRIAKVFKIKEESTSTNLEIAADVFNAFNHLNARTYIGVLTSQFYGRANAALPPRQIQCSIKLTF